MGIPVRTRSGTVVGRLTDLLVETDTGRVAFLLVRSRGFIPGLMDQDLRVAWTQVVSLSEQEAIVADNAVPSGATRFIAGLVGKKHIA